MAARTPDRLPYTGDDEADRLLADDPLALLIGFVLDQQVPLQKAFAGPLELRRRLGALDVRRIAGMEPRELEAIFAARPALHRFPGNMARRTHELCAVIVRDYDGHAGRIWADVSDAGELKQRLLELPGIGAMKADTLIAVLARRFDVRPRGWQDQLPQHPTLADVDSPEALAEYQAYKRTRRAEQRANAGAGRAPSARRS